MRVFYMFDTRDINPKTIWETKDILDKCNSLTVQGFELEAKGREIASRRLEQITSEEDIEWFDNVRFWHGTMSQVILIIWEVLSDSTTEIDLEDYNNALRIGLKVFFNISEYGEKLVGKNRGDILVDFLPDYIFEDIISNMEKYDKAQYKVTGKKGIRFYGNIPEEKYSYSEFVNDMTSIFHQILSCSAKVYQNISVMIPKRVYVHGAGNPYLEKLVEAWWYSSEKLNTQGLYSPDDYGRLFSLIKSTGAEIRVGSWVGHAAHIEPRLRGIIGTYYNGNSHVNNVFMKLLQHYGCNIIRYDMIKHVSFFCPRINNSDFKFMKAVLPFVTSMDLRLDNIKYWRSSEIWEQCKELKNIYSGEELEFRLCLAMGEKTVKESKNV